MQELACVRVAFRWMAADDPLLSSELGLQMSAVQRELPFAEQPSRPISLRSGHPRRDVGLGTMTAVE